MSVYEWSTTAASNATADAAINWAEGQAPSTVNNSARAEMAAMAAFFEAIGGAETTGGTGAAYTLTLNIIPTAYTTSMLFLVKMSTVSTSTTATINVNSLGAKTLKMWDGSALPTAAYLPQDAYVFMKYDGTDMRVFLPSNAPDLASQNTFEDNQTIQLYGNGANEGPVLTMDRLSDTPADSDNIGIMIFQGRNDAAETVRYGFIEGVITDVTDATEDGNVRIGTMTAGTSAFRMTVGAGMYMENSTGTDQGSGTINADAVYDDGVLLCAPIEEASTGSYDSAEWKSLAPHGGLATYEAMKARGYDPQSHVSFANEVLSHGGIPGYWNKAEWASRLSQTKKDHKGKDIIARVSHAEREERKMLALDYLSLAVVSLSNDLSLQKDLAADLLRRVEALEGK
jgi:hypothetical protein